MDAITTFSRSMSVRKHVTSALRLLVMILLLIFFVFPVVFMLVSSVKPNELVSRDMASLMAFVPRQATLENYLKILQEPQEPFLRFMLNSGIVVGGIVLVGIFVNSMAAYSFARLRWRGRNLLLTIIVAAMIIPFQAVSIPLLLEVNSYGWVDTYLVQIIVFIAYPLYIFLFYQFFLSVPRDIETAAQIDGANSYRIYFQIILPLSKPVIATVAILNFIQQWGNFLWPLLVTRGYEHRPLPVAMQTYFGLQPRYWGRIMAFAAMITVPVLILFLIFQKWFVRSVASSGVKG